MKRYWREMTTRDFASDTSRWVAVLPLSAIEQHGPHLPVGVDAMIAEGLVQRLAEALPTESHAVFLPVQQIGKSTEHRSFPGTLTLDWRTAVQTCIEIGLSVAQAGVRKLLIVTSHGGNLSLMDIAARELRTRENMLVVCTSFEKFSPPPIPDTGRVDIHGGTYETSLMLALRPDLADLSKAEKFSSTQSPLRKRATHLGYHSSDATISWLAEDLNPQGVTGDAGSASAESGEKAISEIVARFGVLLNEISETDPPGPVS